MDWYDFFSRFYDVAVERVYRPYRARAAAVLQPVPGGTVVDLACGTGQSFGPLLDRVGASGRVIGIDSSPGMLRQAHRRVSREGWSNVTLVQADARTLDARELARRVGGLAEVDGVFCALGFSVMPEWRSALERSFRLLRAGGQFAILDVHAERRVPQTRWVELVARADLSRRVWEPLSAISSEFRLEFLDGSPHVHGGRVFVATGFRARAGVHGEHA